MSQLNGTIEENGGTEIQTHIELEMTSRQMKSKKCSGEDEKTTEILKISGNEL